MNYINLLMKLFLLKGNEKKSAEQIQKLQEWKLRKLLKFAYKNSEYYRLTFEAKGINEKNIDDMHLSNFPTVDKKAFLMNFDRIVTVSDLTQDEIREFDSSSELSRKPFKGKYHIVHSSGSIGKPGYFVYDEKAWSSMLVGMIRGALSNMTMAEMVRFFAEGSRMVYTAATDGRYGGAMAVGDGVDGIGGGQLYLDINTPLSEWVEKINEFKPNMIVGYLSAVKILAGLAEEKNVDLNIRCVVSCGEPLNPGLREYLERIFGVKVVNYYGTSESLILGAEKDFSEGMILYDDMNVIEAIDGKMYITALYNFAQPLIRYCITDNIKIEKPKKGGLSPFSRAVGLVGRSEDILWFKDNKGKKEFLHPLAIEGFCIEGLLDFQFRQLSDNAFEMLVETAANADKKKIEAEMQRQMKNILAEKKLDYVDFKMNFIDEIKADSKTGKKKLIVGINYTS
ncbi:MAG: phenylacetate--CoA ligase family protein [Clostridiales bacterium]|nr:phenylacetate--CoA ligase family protein [Clostridiales bacterium]